MLEKAIISIDNVDNQEIKMSDKLTWTKKSVLNIFLATNIMKKILLCVLLPKWWKTLMKSFFAHVFYQK